MTSPLAMPSFGIVAEGITDQAVIENALIGYFAADGEEPLVAQIQPPPPDPATPDAHPPGGWSLVFRFFRSKDYRAALQAVDYLVIHIDTDVSHEAGFDVPWHADGRELTPEGLATRVAAKIGGLVEPAFLAAEGHRLLFAIAVHSIECWLLPLLYSDHHASKIKGCLKAANDARYRENERSLSKPVGRGDSTGESKDYRVYDAVSRGYLKRKKLLEGGQKNRSLGIFLEKLAAIRTPTPGAAAPKNEGQDAPAPPALSGAPNEPPSPSGDGA